MGPTPLRAPPKACGAPAAAPPPPPAATGAAAAIAAAVVAAATVPAGTPVDGELAAEGADVDVVDAEASGDEATEGEGAPASKKQNKRT